MLVDDKNACGVLVVDDEPLVLRYTASVMRTLGYKRVFPAGGAQPARALLLAENVTLIITDVSLPDGNGCELLWDALGSNPLALGVLITGFSTDELKVPDSVSGRVTFLQKPFTVTEISHVLSELIERRPALAL